MIILIRRREGTRDGEPVVSFLDVLRFSFPREMPLNVNPSCHSCLHSQFRRRSQRRKNLTHFAGGAVRIVGSDEENLFPVLPEQPVPPSRDRQPAYPQPLLPGRSIRRNHGYWDESTHHESSPSLIIASSREIDPRNSTFSATRQALQREPRAANDKVRLRQASIRFAGNRSISAAKAWRLNSNPFQCSIRPMLITLGKWQL